MFQGSAEKWFRMFRTSQSEAYGGSGLVGVEMFDPAQPQRLVIEDETSYDEGPKVEIFGATAPLQSVEQSENLYEEVDELDDVEQLCQLLKAYYNSVAPGTKSDEQILKLAGQGLNKGTGNLFSALKKVSISVHA